MAGHVVADSRGRGLGVAQSWVATPWKRLKLASLNAISRATRPLVRGVFTTSAEPRDVRRILVVELWNIGDVVLTIPFLAQLRARFPDSSITLLARSHATQILRGMALVDEFLVTETLPAASWLTYSSSALNPADLRRFRRRLKERDFDIAFQSRMHVREHVILAMSAARRRVGYAFGYGDDMLTDALPADDPARHKVSDWLELLKPFGGAMEIVTPMLHVSAAERRWAAEYLTDRGVAPTDTLIGIHPGASIVAKRWPLERFAQVAEALSARSGVRLVTFVEPGGYGAGLASDFGAVTASVTLRELIALVERCTVVVCNDSGPMHIAGALGVPTVAVFGHGIARWFSPLGEGHEVVSAGDAESKSSDGGQVRPSSALEAISATSVIQAVERTLSRAASSVLRG